MEILSNIKQLLSGSKDHQNPKERFKQMTKLILQDLEIAFKDQDLLQKLGSDVKLLDKFIQQIFSKEQSATTVLKYLQTVIIFIQIQEFQLAETCLIKIFESGFFKKNQEYLGVYFFLMAEINVELAEYQKANDFFLEAYQELYPSFCLNERIKFYLHWCNLLVKIKYYDLAENLLDFISRYIDSSNNTYSQLLLLYYHLYKNYYELSMTYCENLQKCDETSLSNNDWYLIYLFSGEYYTNSKDYSKATFHLAKSNVFLIKKWKDYVEKVSILPNYLGNEAFFNIRDSFMSKMMEILLDHNLHFSYLIQSLKNAYDDLQTASDLHYDLALIDTLTGLNNRRYLNERMDEVIESAIRDNVTICCLIYDLDHFKHINDNYGHTEGDKVLKRACTITKDFFRKQDIVVRYGGDEILVILYDAEYDAAIILAEKLRKSLETNLTMRYANETVGVTASIGLACIDKSMISNSNVLSLIIKEADKLMYKAKNNGKNQVVSMYIR